jgi:hypothetical protein
MPADIADRDAKAAHEPPIWRWVGPVGMASNAIPKWSF